MLGSAFRRALGSDAIVATRADLDVRNIARIDALVAKAAPDLVVNCAAHVNAEIAESDPDLAYVANALLPGLLATACRRHAATLVHFSSTGCYGSWKATPYTDEDRLEPTTVHHRSKVSGEEAIRASGCQHLILRLGWLFGGDASHAKNFVWKRLVEAASAPRISSDASQRGSPTHVDDVVRQCRALTDVGLQGTYNCVAKGNVSRFDYVSRIVQAAGLACRIEPVSAFRRAAPVSPNESAVNYRLQLLGLDDMPPWTDSLDRYVAEVVKWPEWQAEKPRLYERLR